MLIIGILVSVIISYWTVWLLIALVSLFVCQKATNFVRERREAHRIFDRGNVPSVGNKNLLSGNLYDIIAQDNNIHIIDQWHERLGKTYGMFFGPDPWVLTTDLDLIHRLFVSEGHRYVDITQLRFPYIDDINNSLAQVGGDGWRKARRSLNPPFSVHQMKRNNVYDDIEHVCQRLMSCIAKHPTTDNSDDQQDQMIIERQQRTIDVQYNFQKYTVEATFRVVYAEHDRINMEPGAKDELIEQIRKGEKLLASKPLYWSIVSGEYLQHLFGFLAKHSEACRHLRCVISSLKQSLERRRHYRQKHDGYILPANERRMIDSIIENADSNKLGEDILQANMLFFFLAGFDTTANTLTCLFWYLASNQSIQDKLRAELLSAGGNLDQRPPEYLDWCIKETMRLHPPVPASVGRVIDHDDNITHGDKKFFKGTSIVASIFSIHRSSEYWGDDVLEFKPERFDEQRFGPIHPAQFMPFALGPRSCIGSNVAMAEMRAITVHILLKYSIKLCASSPKELEISSRNLIHITIHGPVNLSFETLEAHSTSDH